MICGGRGEHKQTKTEKEISQTIKEISNKTNQSDKKQTNKQKKNQTNKQTNKQTYLLL